MTDGTPQPMVFGDIHELLRKVNGESEPAYMWQSDKPKEEVKPEEPSPASVLQSKKDDKEKPPSTEGFETDKEQKPVASCQVIRRSPERVRQSHFPPRPKERKMGRQQKWSKKGLKQKYPPCPPKKTSSRR